MHYTETGNIDGVAKAWCYCGWSEDAVDLVAAEAAAAAHEAQDDE
jgi:hypothetical protein